MGRLILCRDLLEDYNGNGDVVSTSLASNAEIKKI
jgi:hypothetical protein